MTGPILIWLGLLVWAGHFVIAYAFTALACARGFADTTVFGAGIVPVTVALLTAAALSLIALAAIAADRLRRMRPATTRFVGRVGLLVGALSFIAVILTALPTYLGAGCD